MIAISDIIIFFSGMALVTVYNLTRNYLYGRRISVSGITQIEKPHRSLTPKTDLPEVDRSRFDTLLAEVNNMDEFRNTHSRQGRERE